MIEFPVGKTHQKQGYLTEEARRRRQVVTIREEEDPEEGTWWGHPSGFGDILRWGALKRGPRRVEGLLKGKRESIENSNLHTGNLRGRGLVRYPERHRKMEGKHSKLIGTLFQHWWIKCQREHQCWDEGDETRSLSLGLPPPGKKCSYTWSQYGHTGPHSWVWVSTNWIFEPSFRLMNNQLPWWLVEENVDLLVRVWC